MPDVLYIFAHSRQSDEELQLSLRSLERAAPWVGKVWVFGDRPEWLSGDVTAVEHVPHEYVARLGRWKLPLRNTFLMTFLASLIPGLSDPFLWLADDYILLEPVAWGGGGSREAGVGVCDPGIRAGETPAPRGPADLSSVRVLEDLRQVKRTSSLWKDSLWRTNDTLVRLGYATLNFECHVPKPFTRKQLWEAYCDLQDYVSEDRYFGLLMATAVYNHALKQGSLEEPVWLNVENRHVGFYKQPPPLDEVQRRCEGKTFMNFDDKAWGPGIIEFLRERFPAKSKFER